MPGQSTSIRLTPVRRLFYYKNQSLSWTMLALWNRLPFHLFYSNWWKGCQPHTLPIANQSGTQAILHMRWSMATNMNIRFVYGFVYIWLCVTMTYFLLSSILLLYVFPR
jgi:hypothetical protein